MREVLHAARTIQGLGNELPRQNQQVNGDRAYGSRGCKASHSRTETLGFNSTG